MNANSRLNAGIGASPTAPFAALPRSGTWASSRALAVHQQLSGGGAQAAGAAAAAAAGGSSAGGAADAAGAPPWGGIPLGGMGGIPPFVDAPAGTYTCIPNNPLALLTILWFPFGLLGVGGLPGGGVEQRRNWKAGQAKAAQRRVFFSDGTTALEVLRKLHYGRGADPENAYEVIKVVMEARPMDRSSPARPLPPLQTRQHQDGTFTSAVSVDNLDLDGLRAIVEIGPLIALLESGPLDAMMFCTSNKPVPDALVKHLKPYEMKSIGKANVNYDIAIDQEYIESTYGGFRLPTLPHDDEAIGARTLPRTMPFPGVLKAAAAAGAERFAVTHFGSEIPMGIEVGDTTPYGVEGSPVPDWDWHQALLKHSTVGGKVQKRGYA